MSHLTAHAEPTSRDYLVSETDLQIKENTWPMLSVMLGPLFSKMQLPKSP